MSSLSGSLSGILILLKFEDFSSVFFIFISSIVDKAWGEKINSIPIEESSKGNKTEDNTSKKNVEDYKKYLKNKN